MSDPPRTNATSTNRVSPEYGCLAGPVTHHRYPSNAVILTVLTDQNHNNTAIRGVVVRGYKPLLSQEWRRRLDPMSLPS